MNNAERNDSSPIGQLRALAKAKKRPLRKVNMYDPEVCSEFNVMEFLQGVEPPPDRLRYEVSLPFAKHRFAIRANDRYLAIQVRGDFAAGLCAINRPSHSISTYHGEMRSSIPVRSHPVFVPLKSTDPPFLQLEEVRNAILALRLEVDESLAFYGNGISAYIRPRADRHLTDVLTSLAKLASALPPYVTEPLAFTDLPAQFRPLIPLIRRWGIADDDDRTQKLDRASRRQLEALVGRVSPLFGAINEYLDGFGDNVPESAAALGSLAEAAAEAQLILKA